MTGYVDNIEKVTTGNHNFRKVLFTGVYCQLVVMSLKPGEDIGKEVHEHVDQFFRIDAGQGELYMDGETHPIENGFAIVVPAGTEHNIINTGSEDLQLYTIYSPPNHPDGTVHVSRENAMEYEKMHK